MKNIFKSFAILFVVFIGLSFFLLSNQIAGFRGFTVMSGSMEPVIGTGSLAITQRVHPARLKVGDIITFIRPAKDREFITHRITDLSKNKELTTFKTKGDHNNSVDPWILADGGVVGKSVLTIPYLGYFLAFSKTRIGIFLFILVPAFIIIYMEISKIINLIKSRKVKNTIITDLKLPVLLIAIIMPLWTQLPASSALLSDTASIMGNKFTVNLATNNISCDNPTAIEITGNGAGSTNTVNATSNCTYTINQSNTSVITNNVNTNSTTSENSITISNDTSRNIIESGSNSDLPE